MNAFGLFGVVCLVVFVLAGRLLIGLCPPKNLQDWLKVSALTVLVVGSILPLILGDFSPQA